jgi:osmoprotectant transport system permease protein
MKFLLSNPGDVAAYFFQHVTLAAAALGISILIAVPVGFLLYYRRWLSGPVMGVLGVLYTIPSIAMIIFLIPFFGLNRTSVMVALVIYCQVILVRNVLAGLDGIDPGIMEAARGMGMNLWQIAWRVQFPLALPVVLAGLRIAAIAAIAISTMGAKFGAGGLGKLLFDGINQTRMDKIALGAVLVAALALSVNLGLRVLEHRRTGRWTVRRSA